MNNLEYMLKMMIASLGNNQSLEEIVEEYNNYIDKLIEQVENDKKLGSFNRTRLASQLTKLKEVNNKAYEETKEVTE